MSKLQSIEAMRLGLAEAVSASDWRKARRSIDRLKGIVLDSLLQNDPKAIRLAGNALQQAGERLELMADLPMVLDEMAVAWQLRADLGTVALAARMRPMDLDSEAEEDIPSDVPTLLLRKLREANRPISNTVLVDRTGKDPAVISRTLRRLEKENKVQRWRGVNGQQMNALLITQSANTTEQLNGQRLLRRSLAEQRGDEINQLKRSKGNSVRSSCAVDQKNDRLKPDEGLSQGAK